MGFEAPFALVALALAAAPLVIHLLRRRDLKVVRLPSIALLERAQAESRRRFRLTDLLLLFLRVMMLACLLGVLSAPYVTEARPHTQECVAIVIDDSMSMFRRESGQRLFDAAVAEVEAELEALSQGSEVYLVAGGSPARVLAASGLIGDAEQAVADLRDQFAEQASGRGSAIADAIAIGQRRMESSTLGSRRIVVISDFAKTRDLRESAGAMSPVDYRVLGSGEERATFNRAITRIAAIADPTTPGQLSVEATVVRHGPADACASSSVSLHLSPGDGGASEEVAAISGCPQSARVRFHTAIIASGEEASASLSLHFSSSQGDALDVDDTRYFLRTETSSTRVTLISGDQSPRLADDETAFIERALSHLGDERHAYIFHTIDEANLDASTLEQTDVAIIANARPLAGGAEVLAAFRRRGGGVLFTAGNRLDARALRQWGIFEDVDLVLETVDLGLGLSLSGRFMALSPAAGAGLTRERSGLGRTRTDRRLRPLTRPPRLETLLTYADGEPALLAETTDEGAASDGPAMLLLSSIDDDWTDLPYRPGFVPLVSEILRVLSAQRGTHGADLSSGQAALIPQGSEIEFPSGLRRQPNEEAPNSVPAEASGDVPSSVAPRGDVTFDETATPGVYRVHPPLSASRSGRRARTFIVNPDPSESDLTIEALPISEPGLGSDSLGDDGYRRPLAPLLLLAFAIFFILESFLRNRMSRAP